MKSATYIAEITTQKNEKYLSKGENPLACLLASCQLRNFLHEFAGKCFFDQSSHMIHLTWYRSLLFFPGTFFCHSFYGMTSRF